MTAFSARGRYLWRRSTGSYVYSSPAVADGRVFFGSTSYDGKAAFRPAPVNWRNRPQDVDQIAQVVRELAAKLAPATSS